MGISCHHIGDLVVAANNGGYCDFRNSQFFFLNNRPVPILATGSVVESMEISKGYFQPRKQNRKIILQESKEGMRCLLFAENW